MPSISSNHNAAAANTTRIDSQFTDRSASNRDSQFSGIGNSPQQAPTSKKTHLYAPFASKDIIYMAFGINEKNVGKGKQVAQLIVKSNEDKAALESFRKKAMGEAFQNSSGFFHVVNDTMKSNEMNAAQLRSALGESEYDYALNAAEMFANNGAILADLEIISNEEVEVLSSLKEGEDKLVILGHGSYGDNSLASDAKMFSKEVTSEDIAQQLADGGLDKSFGDIRAHSCHSADASKPTSFDPKELDRAQQPFVEKFMFFSIGMKVSFAQSLANELAKAGFENPEVSGYHGSGRMGQLDGHLVQILPDNKEAGAIRSSDVRRVFTPIKV
ncbi:hypothetical protein [Pseudovibrio sp. Ad37]|uniref:hypothetical protein n=1 Tax=Pseudovibrio sp. Ad37 TaxID=989422 RepID=UPI0007AE58F1|nr:hypothetical protein [Pseudovibrio sp. Ad37]KZL24075.1 hypothetical protein PsAD37_02922 [Pseudovibrio sp. Ad37]